MGMNRNASRLLAAAPLVALVGCGGGSSDGGPGPDERVPGVVQYKLTTEFRGDDFPLGVVYEDGVPRPRLIEDTGSELLRARWSIERVDEGEYRFRNLDAGSDRALAVVDDGVFDQLELSDSQRVERQRWRVTPLDNGFCRLTNGSTGPDLAVDVVNEGAMDRLALRESGNFSGQHWVIESTGGPSTAPLSELLECDGEPPPPGSNG